MPNAESFGTKTKSRSETLRNHFELNSLVLHDPHHDQAYGTGTTITKVRAHNILHLSDRQQKLHNEKPNTERNHERQLYRRNIRIDGEYDSEHNSRCPLQCWQHKRLPQHDCLSPNRAFLPLWQPETTTMALRGCIYAVGSSIDLRGGIPS